MFFVFTSKVVRTYGKKLRLLKFDTSGIADQDHLHALLDSVVNDDKDDINNLILLLATVILNSKQLETMSRKYYREIGDSDKTGGNHVIIM